MTLRPLIDKFLPSYSRTCRLPWRRRAQYEVNALNASLHLTGRSINNYLSPNARSLVCVFRKNEACVDSDASLFQEQWERWGTPAKKTVGTRPLTNRDSKKVWERRCHAFPQKSTPVCRPIVCRNDSFFLWPHRM